MALYRFTRNYRSGVLTASVGDVVELSDELVAWLAVDSPGSVAALEDENESVTAAETRAVETPPADRMQRANRKRGDV